MKATHTKGPWFSHIEKCGGNWTFDVRTEANGKGVHIATVNKYRVDQRECDQALIASAPDLLAACEAAYNNIRDGYPNDAGTILEILGAALARARGERGEK